MFHNLNYNQYQGYTIPKASMTPWVEILIFVSWIKTSPTPMKPTWTWQKIKKLEKFESEQQKR